MEQRPLRLGDIVDDYCPRERRITNHAVVALVGDSVRQTRCSTCDAEHVYKDGRLPKRRKKDESVIEGDPPPAMVPAASHAAPGAVHARPPSPPLSAAADEAPAQPETPDPPDDTVRAQEGWLSHRPLIRATLPRTEGEPPPPRPIPEFTMHQRNTRGSQAFRNGGNGWPDRSGGGRNGNMFGNGHPHAGRDPNQAPGQGHGQGQGQGHPHGKRRRHGKRRPPR